MFRLFKSSPSDPEGPTSTRLVVWDFDGTLVDSLATAVGIFNRLAPEMRFQPVTDLAAVRGLSTRQFLRRHGISMWRLPRVIRRYHAHAAGEADKLKLFAGLTELLEGLRTRGVRLGILSSNREDNIRRCLRANGVEGQFAFVVGYPKVFGKARALRRILKAEQIGTTELLYVGDEVRDVEAARKAGVRVAAVTWGYHTEAVLRASQPDHILTDPARLLELVGPSRSAG